jgi:hypothetical protein
MLNSGRLLSRCSNTLLSSKKLLTSCITLWFDWLEEGVRVIGCPGVVKEWRDRVELQTW